MSGRTGGELAEVGELRNGLGHRGWDVGGEARDVGAAIRRFESRSSDLVPHLPPHQHRAEELADRVDELARRVERVRDAMAAADRWVGTNAVLWGLEAELDRQSAVSGWHGARGSWSAFRRTVLDLDHPEEWRHAAFKRALGEGARWMETEDLREARQQLNAANRAIRDGLDRIDARVMRHLDGQALNGLWHDTVADLQRLVGRGPGAARVAVEEATGRLGRLAARAAGTRIGAVARIGGRAVGVAAPVIGALDVRNGLQEGDTEQVATGAISTVAGLAMLSGVPPVQLAGAVVSGGLLVYEYRGEIAAGARRAVDGIGDAAGAAARFVGGLF